MAPFRLPESHMRAALSSDASEDNSEVMSLDRTAETGFWESTASVALKCKLGTYLSDRAYSRRYKQHEQNFNHFSWFDGN